MFIASPTLKAQSVPFCNHIPTCSSPLVHGKKMNKLPPKDFDSLDESIVDVEAEVEEVNVIEWETICEDPSSPSYLRYSREEGFKYWEWTGWFWGWQPKTVSFKTAMDLCESDDWSTVQWGID